MPVYNSIGIGGNATLEELRDHVIRLDRQLKYLLTGGLDDQNINRLNARVIIANTITADKMNVSELSAISANMGTITAGSITTNAEINVGTDARIGNILYLNESDAVSQKGIVFTDDAGSAAEITSLSGDLSIAVDGFITLTIGSSQGLVVNKVVNAAALKSNIITNQSGVSVVFSGASTSSHVQPDHNHGIPDGTVLMVDGGGTVTFNASGGFTHSHTVS